MLEEGEDGCLVIDSVLAGVVVVSLGVVVVVLGGTVPVLPVQSYNFGWMHPSARALEADGQVTEPFLLGQHWLPAQEPQSPSGQHGTACSTSQCEGGAPAVLECA